MRELPYYNLFFQTAHPPVLELAKAIADMAPEGMNHVFFTGSGSEGNDTMLRMVRHYWAIKGQPNKKVIISRKNGYHGSTVAGASLGGMTACMSRATCRSRASSTSPSRTGSAKAAT
jgi:putrescine aminotransferase